MKKNQKSKIKNKKFNSKVKSFRSWINFAFLLAILNFAFLILNSHFAFAQNVRYPIPQLDNCRNARECKLYCDIPSHTPACWSYDKYVMNKDVLGDSTVNITYPIADLGNCTSANECFIFCNQPQNQTTCFDYAKSRGLIREKPKLENIIELAKKELGCLNDLECMVFCQQPDNMDACRTFARKYKLVNETTANDTIHPPPAVMQKARNGLGCSSESECMNLCNKPENSEKCFAFAKENNLISDNEIRMHDNFSKKEAEIMESSKKELGCDSPQACRSICETPENREKCFAFAKKNKLMNDDEIKRMDTMMENKKQMMDAAKGELGCDSEQSCMNICSDQSNRDKCMNLGKKFGMVKDIKEASGPHGFGNMDQKPPLPCTSDAECKKYCESHTNECPGFTSRPANNPSDASMIRPSGPPNRTDMKVSPGDFIGPGGCKSEAECRGYCEKHQTECPGFPKDKNTGLNPASTATTNDASTSNEFPPDCSKSADCRARYCAKYPSRCATATGTNNPPPQANSTSNQNLQTSQNLNQNPNQNQPGNTYSTGDSNSGKYQYSPTQTTQNGIKNDTNNNETSGKNTYPTETPR